MATKENYDTMSIDQLKSRIDEFKRLKKEYPYILIDSELVKKYDEKVKHKAHKIQRAISLLDEPVPQLNLQKPLEPTPLKMLKTKKSNFVIPEEKQFEGKVLSYINNSPAGENKDSPAFVNDFISDAGCHQNKKDCTEIFCH
jgi:hypothetical protein